MLEIEALLLSMVQLSAMRLLVSAPGPFEADLDRRRVLASTRTASPSARLHRARRR
jgi:hypothetical protein